MFDHLLDTDADAFVDLDDAGVLDLVGAQAQTTDWLDALGVPRPEDTPRPDNAKLAREAFVAVTAPGYDPMQAKNAVLALRAPAAVRHLAGMLSEYDWAFVEQAKEIRGYIVANLLEHSKSNNPKVALQALKLLGSVTEVGAFTERVEVTKRDANETEVTQRLREKLARLLPKANAEDAVVVPEPQPFQATGAPAEDDDGAEVA